MKIALLLFAVATFVGLLSARDIPQNVTKPMIPGPSLEYEIVNPAQPKPQKPVDENPNNKSFTYDPATKTWTVVKSSDPEPKEGTLVWNQNNDKWLTQSFWP